MPTFTFLKLYPLSFSGQDPRNHKTRTANYRLWTGYKIQTRYKTQTGKYRLGVKHGLGIERGLGIKCGLLTTFVKTVLIGSR